MKRIGIVTAMSALALAVPATAVAEPDGGYTSPNAILGAPAGGTHDHGGEAAGFSSPNAILGADEPSPVQPVVTTDDGFEWRDAVFGLLAGLALAGGLFLANRIVRRGPRPVEA